MTKPQLTFFLNITVKTHLKSDSISVLEKQNNAEVVNYRGCNLEANIFKVLIFVSLYL